MRIATIVAAIVLAAPAYAKLPPPTEADKLKAAEAVAKSAWTDKVGLYKLCAAMDRTAEAYRRSTAAAGKPVPTPTATAPCTDPGPYVSPVMAAAAKPIEAAGAHSPPGTAVSPPSSKASAAEIAGSAKK